MALYHRTVTIAVTTGFTLASVITGIGDVIRYISIQADPANSAVLYVGGKDATLSSTDCGWIIPIPITSIPAPPIAITSASGAFSLGDIQLLGTTTQKAHLIIVTP